MNRFQDNPNVLNLIVFKKFISDNALIDSNFEENERRNFENRTNTLGSNNDDTFNFKY